MEETGVLSLGWEDALRKIWQPTPVWLPGKYGQRSPGRLQSMGSQRVGHDLVTIPQHQFPYAHFLKSFPITNRHWILSIIFLCLLRWSYGFYSSLYSCGISYWFADTEKNLCILKINPTWSWCMILLTSCWIQFSIFLRISVLTFFSNTDLQFSFLCGISLSGFGIRVMVASQNDFRSVPSSAIFKLNIAG